MFIAALAGFSHCGEALPRLADSLRTPLRTLPESCPWYRDGMPDTRTSFYPAIADFYRQQRSEYYENHGIRDPKWDDQARAFLDALLVERYVLSFIVTPELAECAKAVLAANCGDPYVSLMANRISLRVAPAPEGDAESEEEPYAPTFIAETRNVDATEETAIADPERRKALRIKIITLAQDVLAGDGGAFVKYEAAAAGASMCWSADISDSKQYTRFSHAMADMYVKFIDDIEGWRRDEIAYEIWYRTREPIHYRRDKSYIDTDAHLLDLLSKQSAEFQKRHAGLIHTIAGIRAHNLAWLARGGGLAKTVKPEAWEQFRKHSAEARKLLESAYKENPRNPFVCAWMVSVARDNFKQSGESREWFIKGLWGRVDLHRLYSEFVWRMRPRWGGSHESMAAFGWECLHTKRFDTWTPYRFVGILYDIAGETGGMWRTLFREKRIADAMRYVHESYLAEETFAYLHPYFRMNYACILILCGEYAEAGRQYRLVPENIRRLRVFPMDFSGCRFPNQSAMVPTAVALFTGEHADEMSVAESAQLKGEFGRAADLYGAVLERFEKDSPETMYLLGRIAECLVWEGSRSRNDSFENERIYKRLVKNHLEPGFATDYAARANRADLVEKFLAIDPVVRPETLFNAIARKDSGVTTALLRQEGMIGTRLADYYPIHQAANNSDVDMYKLVEQYEPDKNRRSGIGFTPLQVAAYFNRADVVRYMLESGEYDIEAATGGNTALVYTARNNAGQSAALLLDAGASTNIVDKNKRMPLHTAIINRSVAVFDLLLRHGADIHAADYKGNRPLHLAVQTGCPDMAMALVRMGADVDAVRDDGLAPLTMACQKNQADVVACLLEYGANLELEGEPNGVLPLHSAILSKNDAILALLLKSGASPDRKSRHGLTPFDVAMRYGSRSGAALLVDNGANVDQPSGAAGHAFLHTTVIENDGDMFERVMARTPNLDGANAAGQTPLHLAAALNRATMVETLLKAGASPLARDASGKLPREVAPADGDASIASLLRSAEMWAMAALYWPYAAGIFLCILAVAYMRRRRKRPASAVE